MRHVVCFGSGRLRRYLARPDGEGAHAKGWRSFIWTADVSRAEMFSTAKKAEAFATEHLPHGEWTIGGAPPRGRPTGDTGGTPVAMRLAA